MAEDTVVTIEIHQWERYNPRADRGGFSWFRMDNRFYLHMRQRKGLSADATVLMGFLLAEYSAHDCKPFKLRVKFAAKLLGRPASSTKKALAELVDSGEISCEALQAASSGSNPNRQTDRQTCGSTLEAHFDFESLYKIYPARKGDQGKKAGLKKCEKIFTSQEQFEKLKKAITNYAAHCDAEKLTGTPYVKQFKTFVHDSWDEWANSPGQQPFVLKSVEELTDGL